MNYRFFIKYQSITELPDNAEVAANIYFKDET